MGKQVIGASRLRRKLQRMPEEITQDLKAVIAEQAESIVTEMKNRVPVSQGAKQPVDFQGRPREHLQDALQVGIRRGGLQAKIGLFGARVRKVFFFARFLEFGTRKMAKRPFVFPAWMAHRARVRAAVRDATIKALRRTASLPLSDE